MLRPLRRARRAPSTALCSAALCSAALCSAAIALAGCADAPTTPPPPAPVAPPAAATAVAEPRLLRIPVPGGYTDVSAGTEYTCAVRTDHVIGCVGNPRTPPPNAEFTRVSAGNGHSCALRFGGEVVCWGSNVYGQAPPSRTTPFGFVQVSVGEVHTCALRADGVVECWGSNDAGRAPATRSAASGRFVHVGAGFDHTCAVRDDGKIECWGDGRRGQTTPLPSLTSDDRFTQVSSGVTFSCALRTDGVIRCWGANTYGQAPGTWGAASGAFIQLSASNANVCALRTDGVVQCLGTYPSDVPPATRAAATGSYVQVAAGYAHGCARRTDGVVECWGRSRLGEAPAILDIDPRVQPAATFTAPDVVDEGATIPLGLLGAHVPGFPDVTGFTFAFQCTSGYGAFSVVNLVWCPGADGPAVLTLKGTVKDPDGDTREYAAQVTVRNVAPRGTLEATTPPAGTSTFVVRLIDAYDVPADQPTLTYAFDCGDGKGYSAYAPSISFTCSFLAAGRVTVAGKVRDKDGGENEYVTHVDLPNPNRAPFALAGGPYAGGEGLPIAFDGRASFDQDGDALTYGWDFGDGTTGSGATPTHAYADQGRYTVTLTVTDGRGGSHAHATTADIANRAPTAQFSAETPAAGATSFLLQLDDAKDVAADRAALRFTFDCGTGYGAPGTAPFISCSTTPGGTRTVKGKVEDGDGGATEYSATIAIPAPLPRARQRITFTSTPPNPAQVGKSYTVVATGGASGNPVTFTSLTPAVCTVSGSAVQLVDVGTCTVAADQAESAGYDAAPRVTQSFAATYAFAWYNAAFGAAGSVNVIYAGTVYHLRFRLGANLGTSVLAAGAPTSRPVACPTWANVGALPALPAPVASALRWDAATNAYDYTWQTQVAWKGTCREFTLTFRDGTVRTVLFQLG